MNWKALHARMVWEHRSEPSKAKLLELALDDLERAQSTLAQHGHQFTISEGPQPPTPEWPQTRYHYELGIREITCLGDLWELGPGWYKSPQEASQAYGLEIQFEGRGAVKRPSRVPASISGQESEFVSDLNWKQQAKNQFLAERSKRNGSKS